jgi:hypothetical protein
VSGYHIVKIINNTDSTIGISRGSSLQSAIREAQSYAGRDRQHTYQVLAPDGRVVFQA